MDETFKELNEAVEFIVELANAIGKASEDKKATVSDAVHLMPLLYKIPSALDGLEMVPDEAKKMDAEKMAAMSAMIKEKLDLPQEKLELAIEGSLDILVRVYALAQSLKA